MRALPWVLVFGLLSALIVMRAWGDVGYAKLADAQQRADSLYVVAEAHRTEAHRADTVLVEITDTLLVTVERTRVVQAAQADSVRAHTDSIGAAHLDSLIVAHETEVEALTALADARLVWGNTWKDYAQSLEAVNAELRIANDLAQGIIRRQRRNGYLQTAGIVLVGAALVVGAVK